jgi:hypothetical protein
MCSSHLRAIPDVLYGFGMARWGNCRWKSRDASSVEGTGAVYGEEGVSPEV